MRRLYSWALRALNAGSLWELLAVYACIAMAVGLVCAVKRAQAQDEMGGDRPAAQHNHYHEYYKTWLQPVPPNDSGYTPTCCSATSYTEEGTLIGGDCEPTMAEMRKGADGLMHWWAKLPQWYINKGEGDSRGYVEIPDSRIVRQTNPEPQSAHLCWVPYDVRVLCFVPPFGGF